MVAWTLLWLALVQQRLKEVRVAAHNTDRLRALGAVEVAPGHYPVMVALHTAWFVLWLLESLTQGVKWTPFWLLPALVGQILRAWTRATLQDRWTTRILVLPRETPVSSGPFRWWRHPNYLGVVLELFAFPLASGAWRTGLTMGLANLVLLGWRIHWEERAWKDLTSGNS